MDSIDFEQTETLEIEKNIKTRKKSENLYKPKYFSGGWAILIGLLDDCICEMISLRESNIQEYCKHYLNKQQIIERANLYSRFSFFPKPGENYSAWNSIKTIENHDLVVKIVPQKRNDGIVWQLSDKGLNRAWKLVCDFDHQFLEIKQNELDSTKTSKSPAIKLQQIYENIQLIISG